LGTYLQIRNDWKLVWNKNSPNLHHIIAKIFNKYFYSMHNSSLFLPNAAIAGTTRAWGGKGGTAVPPHWYIIKFPSYSPHYRKNI
jgi:hypothetical protein